MPRPPPTPARIRGIAMQLTRSATAACAFWYSVLFLGVPRAGSTERLVSYSAWIRTSTLAIGSAASCSSWATLSLTCAQRRSVSIKQPPGTGPDSALYAAKWIF